jgi:hypothetical protein
MESVQSSHTSNRIWERVSSRRPCPICAKHKGCSVSTDGLVTCLRVESDKPLDFGLGGWSHSLSNPPPQQDRPLPLTPTARRAQPAALDLVYRALLNEHPLLERHQIHLRQKRGLKKEAIECRGYRSWGFNRHSRLPIARQMVELFGSDAIDTPGIIVRQQGERDQYVSLAGSPGLAIPIRNADDQIIGLQIMPDDRQPGGAKYLWLSSSHYGGAKPGTPVHVARPKDGGRKSGRVWLTEGPLKADIACELLGEIVIAVPGVNALAELIPTLTRLLELGDLVELVIALDSDWHTNEKVAKARHLVAERSAALGIPVWLADWDTACKGLDDLLQAGGRPRLEVFQVTGSGPRKVETTEPAEVEKDRRPRYSLEEAREIQDQFIWRAINTRPEKGKDLGFLIKTLPGSGKSHALTRAINRLIAKKKKVRIAGFIPRHDLANEPGREFWVTMRGRTHTTAELPTPCILPEKQKRLTSLRIIGQKGCERCPHQEVCKSNTDRSAGLPFYLNQFEQKAPITLYPAQHLMTPSVWSSGVQVIAADDLNLLSLCLEEINLNRNELEAALRWANSHPEHGYADAQPLLHLLVELTRTVPVTAFEWSGEGLFQRLSQLAEQHQISLKEVLRRASGALEPDPFAGTDLLHSRLDVPKRFVNDLTKVLLWELNQWNTRSEREVVGWNRRVRLERSATTGDVILQLNLRRDLPLKALEGKILLLLDASMTLEEAQMLFPDRTWEVLDLQVRMPDSVTIHQDVSQNWGVTRLRQSRFQEQALEIIAKILDQHPGEKTAVITHKSFSELVKKRFPDVLVGHYHGQRGSNKFADCTVQICFGTPYPNMDQVERQAEALYWDGPTINRQTFLEGRTHRSRKGKKSLRSSVRTYRDSRLRRMLRNICEDELTQSAYRLRPLDVKGFFEHNPTGQLNLKMFEAEPTDVRTHATVYIFSGVALPGLEVEVKSSAPTSPVSSPVRYVDFAAATRQIQAYRERVTIARLAEHAQASTYETRRWAASPAAPRTHLGSLAPPAHAPPLSITA